MSDTKNPLAEENEALKARLAALEADRKQASADETVIQEKMRKGLSREQAITVIRRQREYDKQPTNKK